MAPPTQPQRNARPIIPTPISPMTPRPENVPVPPSVGVTRRQNSTVAVWHRESRRSMCTLNILAERVVKMSLRVILLPTPCGLVARCDCDARQTPPTEHRPIRQLAGYLGYNPAACGWLGRPIRPYQSQSNGPPARASG